MPNNILLGKLNNFLSDAPTLVKPSEVSIDILGIGYDTYAQETKQRGVSYEGVDAIALETVPNETDKVDRRDWQSRFTYVRNKHDLFQSIGLDATAAYKSPAVTVDARLSFAQQISLSEDQTAIVFSGVLRKRRYSFHDAKFSDDAKGDAIAFLDKKMSTEKFLARYGDRYIKAATVGASLYIVLRAQERDFKKIEELKASIAAKGKAVQGSINASRSVFEKATSDSVSFDVAVVGPQGPAVSSFLGNNNDALQSLLGYIDGFQASARASDDNIGLLELEYGNWDEVRVPGRPGETIDANYSDLAIWLNEHTLEQAEAESMRAMVISGQTDPDIYAAVPAEALQSLRDDLEAVIKMRAKQARLAMAYRKVPAEAGAAIPNFPAAWPFAPRTKSRRFDAGGGATLLDCPIEEEMRNQMIELRYSARAQAFGNGRIRGMVWLIDDAGRETVVADIPWSDQSQGMGFEANAIIEIPANAAMLRVGAENSNASGVSVSAQIWYR